MPRLRPRRTNQEALRHRADRTGDDVASGHDGGAKAWMMSAELQGFYDQIAKLEARFADELQRTRSHLDSKLEGGTIVFDEHRQKHGRMAKKVHLFIYDSGINALAVAPLMCSMIVPQHCDESREDYDV